MLRPPRHLGLFAGNDLSTALLLKRLIPEVKAQGWQPKVYLAKNRPFSPTIPFKLLEFYWYERELLKTAGNILAKPPIEINIPCHSHRALLQHLNVSVEEVASVNSNDFLQKMTQELDAALSLRFLQIFSGAFIEIFNKKENGFLWNLHSGALPQCRGAMPLFWTMLKQEQNATLSLHEVAAGIDAGNIVGVQEFALDPKKSLLETSCQSVEYGATLITELLKKQAERQVFPFRQKESPKNYYSYPKKENIDQFISLNCKMLPPQPIDFVVNQLTAEGSIESKELQASFDKYIAAFEQHEELLTSISP